LGRSGQQLVRAGPGASSPGRSEGSAALAGERHRLDRAERPAQAGPAGGGGVLALHPGLDNGARAAPRGGGAAEREVAVGSTARRDRAEGSRGPNQDRSPEVISLSPSNKTSCATPKP